MNITVRNYKPLSDFEPIRQFLIKNHQYHNADGNVYPSEWEYMHTHSLAPWILFPRIGIWEDNGEIVAVATLEWFLGEFMLQINPDYAFLKPELLHYAEENLSVMNADGTRTLCVSRLHNTDTEMEELLIRQGYHMAADSGWAGFFDLSGEVPQCPLPEGFSIVSLQEENDLEKINRVMWRGFEHPNEPDCSIDTRRVMQSGPHFRPELNLVVKALNGDYAVYCGMWYEPECREAYLEPLCSDPDYRKMGLAKAALYEAMRRTKELGAPFCVAGGQPFYEKVGFVQEYVKRDWEKTW